MLVPGGVLALFGRPAELKDPDLFAAVEEIEKQVLPDDDRTVVHPWSVEDMATTDGLIDAVQRDLPCVVTTTAADFGGRLATVSAYLMLSPPGARRRPAPSPCGASRPIRYRRHDATVPGSTGLTAARVLQGCHVQVRLEGRPVSDPHAATGPDQSVVPAEATFGTSAVRLAGHNICPIRALGTGVEDDPRSR